MNTSFCQISFWFPSVGFNRNSLLSFKWSVNAQWCSVCSVSLFLSGLSVRLQLQWDNSFTMRTTFSLMGQTVLSWTYLILNIHTVICLSSLLTSCVCVCVYLGNCLLTYFMLGDSCSVRPSHLVNEMSEEPLSSNSVSLNLPLFSWSQGWTDYILVV